MFQSEADDVDAMVYSILSDLGNIQISVNNAGVPAESSSAIESSAEDWDRIIAVHLRGNNLCSRSVGKWIIARKTGMVVNTGSIAGVGGGYPLLHSYGAAKAMCK